MVGKKAPFVNMCWGIKYIILLSFFSAYNLFAPHTVVINFEPYPKEIYEGLTSLTNEQPLSKNGNEPLVLKGNLLGSEKNKKVEFSEKQAINGNVIIYDGTYSIGGKQVIVDGLSDVSTIKLVITDRLKPLPFKTPLKLDSKEILLGSTNKGIALDLSDSFVQGSPAEKDKQEEAVPKNAKKMLAKCFLLTKKNVATHNFAWDRKIVEIIEGQPLPADFTNSFLTPDNSSGVKTYKNAVFQNDVIFFAEDPNNADMDIDRPVLIGENQKATEDAVLPNILVRTDVDRVSISKILESLPFLTKITQSEKKSKNVMIVRTLENSSTSQANSATAQTIQASASPAIKQGNNQ